MREKSKQYITLAASMVTLLLICVFASQLIQMTVNGLNAAYTTNELADLQSATNSPSNISEYEYAEPISNETTANSINIPTTQEASESRKYSVVECVATKAETVIESTKQVEPRYTLTSEEKCLIAKLACLEDFTNDESLMAVCEVVLNRLESDKFPDTVKEVIFAPKQFQCQKVLCEAFVSIELYEQGLRAVERVFVDGESIVPGAVFFSEKSVKPGKIAKRLVLVGEYGESKFYSQE